MTACVPFKFSSHDHTAIWKETELTAKKLEIDYLNLFGFDEINPAEEIKPNSKYILGGTVYLGKTRLIYNMIIET